MLLTAIAIAKAAISGLVSSMNVVLEWMRNP